MPSALGAGEEWQEAFVIWDHLKKDFSSEEQAISALMDVSDFLENYLRAEVAEAAARVPSDTAKLRLAAERYVAFCRVKKYISEKMRPSDVLAMTIAAELDRARPFLAGEEDVGDFEMVSYLLDKALSHVADRECRDNDQRDNDLVEYLARVVAYESKTAWANLVTEMGKGSRAAMGPFDAKITAVRRAIFKIEALSPSMGDLTRLGIDLDKEPFGSDGVLDDEFCDEFCDTWGETFRSMVEEGDHMLIWSLMATLDQFGYSYDEVASGPERLAALRDDRYHSPVAAEDIEPEAGAENGDEEEL